ncbi:MAG TPA: zf-HC2 domain-containing protein [Longimicrobiales bacterium]
MSDSTLHPNTERLQSFVEGILGDAERVVVESHLLSCTTCQTEVEEWRSLFGMLATMPQFSPSIYFADNVMRSVQLPDPWYVRALVFVGDRLHQVAPKTTRGWAAATAFLSVPFAIFAALTAWVISKPYITPRNVFAFAYTRVEAFATNAVQAGLDSILQTDIALFVARGLNAIATAGVGTAGAMFAGVAVATAASAYVLYQNLFRARAQTNQRYVTYSF